MRYFIALVALAAGCASNPAPQAAQDPAPRTAQEQEALERYTANCEQLGFAPGTPEHRDCYLRFYKANTGSGPAARP